ncbi:MAG: hypothetical protein ACAH80_16190 [Alphaproteobacteria bacterium]
MNWKFWELFRSDETIEEAIEHSVGYDLSPDAAQPVTAVAANEDVVYAAQAAQPAAANALNLDYAFVFPANSQDGMPQSRFPEPWEKEENTKKKA